MGVRQLWAGLPPSLMNMASKKLWFILKLLIIKVIKSHDDSFGVLPSLDVRLVSVLKKTEGLSYQQVSEREYDSFYSFFPENPSDKRRLLTARVDGILYQAIVSIRYDSKWRVISYYVKLYREAVIRREIRGANAKARREAYFDGLLKALDPSAPVGVNARKTDLKKELLKTPIIIFEYVKNLSLGVEDDSARQNSFRAIEFYKITKPPVLIEEDRK